MNRLFEDDGNDITNSIDQNSDYGRWKALWRRLVHLKKKIEKKGNVEEETESTVLQGDLFKEIYVVRMKIKE